MQVATAISLIQRRLGNRTGLDAIITLELDASREYLESRGFLPWFLQASAVQPYSANGAGVPPGFIRFNDEGTGLYYRETETQTWKPLERKELDQVLTCPDYNGTGTPSVFVLRGLAVTLFPSPAGAYQLYFDFYKSSGPVLVGDNAWLTYASGLIMAVAGLRTAESVRATDSAQLFQSDLQLMEGIVREADTAAREAARSRFMGG